jgi:hypothetical protein
VLLGELGMEGGGVGNFGCSVFINYEYIKCGVTIIAGQ